MKLFILGATGKTGLQLVDQAIRRGHTVTTFGRASANHVVGSPMDTPALADATRGHDAVISTIGARTLNAHDVRTRSARAVIDAMQRAGVRRLVIMSSTLVDDHQGWKTRFFSRTLLRSHADDQRSMETVVRASNLDWTIVRPPTLTNGPLTGGGAIVKHEPGEGTISRADTAKLMLDIVESGSYARQIVWTTSAGSPPSSQRP